MQAPTRGAGATDLGAPGVPCPDWCVSQHGVHLGEEDWVHLSAPLAICEDVLAQACVSILPDGGVDDGPYVLVGSRQYTLEEAAALGAALVALARGAGVIRLAGP